MSDRTTEWFVPQWGPVKFRIFVGLLFLPYTGMVLSFTVIGAMLADTLHWDRVIAALIVYFLGLGIAAHALDALGSKKIKPWGEHFSRTQLWVMAIVSLVAAYAIIIYYIVTRDLHLLWTIAILEGFFVFAYNLEWFKGKFHTDGWFCFSWGMLPVLAGYMMQTNRISMAAVVMAISMGLLSLVEISASRPYKELKRGLRSAAGLTDAQSLEHIRQYERILKSISLGVILLGLGLLVFRFWR
jgi:xanthine/uracil permease